MAQLGIGVMLNQLFGNSTSVAAFTGAIGKKILSLNLGEDDALRFEFEDGSKLKLFDNGQSCCESRYMRTDDKLEEYIGAELVGAEIKSAPDEMDEDGYGAHEVEFLEIQTTKGHFTMISHNEHNGYYGGFSITASAD